MELKDKTIAITGGGRGLGAAMAVRLAKLGSRIALIDLEVAGLEKTAGICRSAGSPKSRLTKSTSRPSRTSRSCSTK